jgi:hypothetical protein
MGKLQMDQIMDYKKIRDIRNLITEKQIIQMQNLTRFYDNQTIKNRLTNIRDFIICGVDKNWLSRLKIIKTKLKNDVCSDYSCKIRYGDFWREKKQDFVDKTRMNKEKFISMYGEEVGFERWKSRNQKLKTYGLEAAVNRYGVDEGKVRWEKTLAKKVSTMKHNKKVRKYRNGRTLPEYQQRYGIEEGFQKWDRRNKSQAYRFSKDYYIEKYGEIDGEVQWKLYCENMVKTTKESFIKRYGEEKGVERYESFVKNVSYKQSEEYFISLYGEEIGKQKYIETTLKKISFIKDKYSKISQELFWSIYENIENKKECFFYELNEEYLFYVWSNDLKVIRVDFKCGSKIIEFDGTFWHSSEKQKEIDRKRDDFLKKKGYIVLRISEDEYRKDKKTVLDKCLIFLNK